MIKYTIFVKLLAGFHKSTERKRWKKKESGYIQMNGCAAKT